MERPQYQTRGGESYMLHDPEDNTFHFVYLEPSDTIWVPSSRWMIDRWTPNAIRNESVRFYRFVNPTAWYRSHSFATVNDDGVLVQYNLTENNELLDAIRNTGETGIAYETAQASANPPDDDRRFREGRDGIHVVPGQPPAPPGGGGGVVAQAAEPEGQQDQGEELAQVAGALRALVALAVREPALPAAEPEVHVQPSVPDNRLAALRLLAEMSAAPSPAERIAQRIQALRALPNYNTIITGDRLADAWGGAWAAAGDYGRNGYGVYHNDNILRPLPLDIPLNIDNVWADYHSPRQPPRPPLAPPQKRVAALVIADAVKNTACCPITMEPIKEDTAACVAPCYHVFEKEAVTEWLARNHTCPQCREACCL